MYEIGLIELSNEDKDLSLCELPSGRAYLFHSPDSAETFLENEVKPNYSNFDEVFEVEYQECYVE